jgi:hypothetical protein
MIKDLAQYTSEFSAWSQEIRPVNIIAFDTEDDTKGTPVSCAFFSKDGHYYTTSMDEAIDYIYSIQIPSVFVAHNLEYDIGNLFKHCDWKYIENMMYSGKLLKADLLASKHYFINSNSFFGGPLKKMGEALGYPKLDGDVTNPEYVIRDAEIVYRFMSKFQEYLNNELQVNLGITIGQLSMAAYRTNYMEKPIQKTYNSPLCLKAYYGGRVEIFYAGAVENVFVTDINSSYPNVMRKYAYPDSGYMESSSIHTHEFGVGKFKVEVPKTEFVPLLPVKSTDGRLFFPTGIFTGYWTYHEVRLAVEHGARIIKEYYGEGTNRACFPFVKFIDDFYKKRLKAKEVKNDFEVLFYKLFMNNLYGKWCQHKGGATINREPMSAGQALKKKVSLDRKLGNFYCYTSLKNEPPKTANYIWGVYVTAYARIELFKGLQTVYKKGGTLIYCDTDSVMFTGIKNPLPVSRELGDWDEEKYDLGVFRQAKGYLLCNKVGNDYEIKKVACKGVNTSHAYDFIIRGMARVMKPIRFKESIVRINASVNSDAGADFIKEMGVNVWREVEKKMTSIYIKRQGVGEVKYPVDYDYIRELEDNSDTPVVSIEKELKKKYNIKRKRIKRAFANIKIPANWFKRNSDKKLTVEFFESQKIKWIKTDDCKEIQVGQTWFSGHVHSIAEGLYGNYYRILLTKYRNIECPIHFWGAISIKFLNAMGYKENLVGFFLDAKLKKEYILNKPLVIGFEISDSEVCVRNEEENLEVSELSSEETENLLNADWSFLDGIK